MAGTCSDHSPTNAVNNFLILSIFMGWFLCAQQGSARVQDGAYYHQIDEKVQDVLTSSSGEITEESNRALNRSLYELWKTARANHGKACEQLTSEETKPIHDALEPLRAFLVPRIESNLASDREMAVRMLGTMKLTDWSMAAIVGRVRDSDANVASEALDIMFKYGFEPSDLRKELVSLAQANIEGNKSSLGGLTVMGSDRWGLGELVPAIVARLKADVGPGRPVDRNLVRRLCGLHKPPASAATTADELEVLEKLLDQRKRDGDADFREMEDLEGAVEFVRSGCILMTAAQWHDVRTKRMQFPEHRIPAIRNESGKSDEISAANWWIVAGAAVALCALSIHVWLRRRRSL